MKRVLTVQDISCLGKCSLTIALPVLSVLGSETVILPTAVLSTHTMFKGFTCKDLSDQIEPIKQHWLKEDIAFDAIYTGYLGSIEQIDQMKDLFRDFRREGMFVFVDPVMADNGRLYAAFDMEAALMTGMDYKETYDESYILALLSGLRELGAKLSVITGVSLEKGKIGAMGIDRETGETWCYQNCRIDASYHGTGDLFASTFVGELLRGKDWKNAMRIAADYTAHTIEVTLKNPKEPWYGVDFETTLPDLLKLE